MQYRRMGDSGLKLSVLSFGSWITFGGQMGLDESLECMQNARDAGVNFFDNAEVYAGGQAEQVMGDALAEFGWPRHSYLVSTKYFWGIHRDVPNAYFTLNRKYLLEAIDRSLERLQLDYVDLVYCHRPDPETTIEETVWAMSDIVAAGKALYWGTSEWSAAEILSAIQIAETQTRGAQQPVHHRQQDFAMAARRQLEALCDLGVDQQRGRAGIFGRIDRQQLHTRSSLHRSPFFVTRAPRRRCGGVHGVEGGEGVADTTSNRLQRDRFARSETGRTRCARRADARDGIGQRPVMTRGYRGLGRNSVRGVHADL